MMPQVENKELDVVCKKIKKERNNYKVTFLTKDDEEKVYKFSEDHMVEYRITLDKWFTNDELDKIIKSCNISKWYSKALNYIFIKPRTKKEIKDYLSKSDLDDVSIKSIIEKLESYKYLNDEEYTKSFIDLSLSNGFGKKYIIHSLKRLGISDELINIYITEVDERSIIADLIKKYQKIELTLITFPVNKQKLKLMTKMAQKGISSSIIQEVLKNITFTEDIKETFKKDLQKVKKQTEDKYKQIEKLLRLGYTYDYIKRHIDV